ncbi:hypothetical protein OPT61_g721 [Boeremia exigua]|uniref:Uncharacterized protein n=1 Tax=Boeremia exigua TaxID=749465 RepID=A0ACC2IT42_9PLEO|nr:hypothetical protein OPT61_g721 [Boeremia exigua]
MKEKDIEQQYERMYNAIIPQITYSTQDEAVEHIAGQLQRAHFPMPETYDLGCPSRSSKILCDATTTRRIYQYWNRLPPQGIERASQHFAKQLRRVSYPIPKRFGMFEEPDDILDTISRHFAAWMYRQRRIKIDSTSEPTEPPKTNPCVQNVGSGVFSSNKWIAPGYRERPPRPSKPTSAHNATTQLPPQSRKRVVNTERVRENVLRAMGTQKLQQDIEDTQGILRRMVHDHPDRALYTRTLGEQYNKLAKVIEQSDSSEAVDTPKTQSSIRVPSGAVMLIASSSAPSNASPNVSPSVPSNVSPSASSSASSSATNPQHPNEVNPQHPNEVNSNGTNTQSSSEAYSQTSNKVDPKSSNKSRARPSTTGTPSSIAVHHREVPQTRPATLDPQSGYDSTYPASAGSDTSVPSAPRRSERKRAHVNYAIAALPPLPKKRKTEVVTTESDFSDASCEHSGDKDIQQTSVFKQHNYIPWLTERLAKLPRISLELISINSSSKIITPKHHPIYYSRLELSTSPVTYRSQLVVATICYMPIPIN